MKVAINTIREAYDNRVSTIDKAYLEKQKEVNDMDKEIYPRYELGKLLNITYQTKIPQNSINLSIIWYPPCCFRYNTKYL